MQCNIDQRGRTARALWGIVMVLLAAGWIAAWLYSGFGGWWSLIGAALLAATGLFSLYEAKKGWCVMRAMGFRTPM